MSSAFFNFDKYNKILNDFLGETIAKNHEFEIRFGKFYKSDANGNSTNGGAGGASKRFDSNIELESFYKLKNTLNQQKNIIKTEKQTKEFVYNTEKGNIKKIINTCDNQTKWLIKRSIKHYDIYDYDLRMSLASEEEIDGTDIYLDVDVPSIVRNKTRFSYDFGFGHLDLTIVDQETDGKNTRKYEVEFEINNNQIKSSEQSVVKNLIISFITSILQTRQDNFYII